MNLKDTNSLARPVCDMERITDEMHRQEFLMEIDDTIHTLTRLLDVDMQWVARFYDEDGQADLQRLELLLSDLFGGLMQAGAVQR